MQKCAAAFLLHITFCVLTCQIFSTEQLNAEEKVGELAGIGIITFKLIQSTHRLHANVVIGMGEQLIAILIGARNGGSFAVKGQGRKVIGKAAEVGTAAVLPQPASRETDRASTVTIPRTFFIIRMENPSRKIV